MGTARGQYFGTGAAVFRHGTANSDSVNGAGSAPVPRFLAVPSTTKYVCLGTPISRAVPAFTQVYETLSRAVEKISVRSKDGTHARSGANFQTGTAKR